eukprot:5362862-Pyramimonas_sp.AAC.1
MLTWGWCLPISAANVPEIEKIEEDIAAERFLQCMIALREVFWQDTAALLNTGRYTAASFASHKLIISNQNFQQLRVAMREHLSAIEKTAREEMVARKQMLCEPVPKNLHVELLGLRNKVTGLTEM